MHFLNCISKEKLFLFFLAKVKAKFLFHVSGTDTTATGALTGGLNGGLWSGNLCFFGFF